MKKSKIVQIFLAVLVFAGIVFFGCTGENPTNEPSSSSTEYDCVIDDSCDWESSSSGEEWNCSMDDSCGEDPSSSSEEWNCSMDDSCGEDPSSSSEEWNCSMDDSCGEDPSSSSNSVTNQSSSSLNQSSSARSSSSANALSSSSRSSSSVNNVSSSSNMSSSSAVVSSSSQAGGIGNCIAPPGDVTPPNGINTCIAVNGKCYKCNSDRGNDCLMSWLWKGEQVTDAYWFSEIACSGSGGNSSSSTNTPRLTCGNAYQNITTAEMPTKPSVTCGGATPANNELTWTPDLNARLAAGSYNNVSVKATSGNCNGQTVTCSGTITVTAVQSSSSRPSSSSVTSTPSSSSRPSSSSVGGGSTPYSSLAQGNGVREGWASRYWDGCKPSCGWSGNAGGNPTRSCGINGVDRVNNDTQSKCAGGSAHTCYSQAPWVEGDVAYAFAASHTNGDCGKCFQIQFTGASENNPNQTDRLNFIRGKTLIIKVSNIGGDVSGTQFDLMIPGGGLGAFDGFTMQTGVNSGSLGAQYGGIASTCGSRGSLSAVQECIRTQCDAAFNASTAADLRAGCKVYADWFGGADNPKFLTKEITCPSQLNSKW